MHVKDVMTTPVVTLRPETPIKEAAALLVRHGVSGAPVVDEHEQLVGIVSESDLMALETTPDPRSRIRLPRWRRVRVPRRVEQVMTRDVVTLPERADVADAARLMLERRVKRIPVVAEGRVVGIVSRRDVLRLLARTDGEIRAELQELLSEEILILGRFEAQVEDGVVTLAGPPDPRARRLAELLARSVGGVVGVRFTT
ncbi:MAG TPA: CBS domain-containing protein [Actinomycetota bacterium]